MMKGGVQGRVKGGVQGRVKGGVQGRVKGGVPGRVKRASGVRGWFTMATDDDVSVENTT